MTSVPELGWLLDDLVTRVQGIRKALILTRDGGEHHVPRTAKGQVADANTQGWLTRFFNSQWFPF